MKRALSIVMMIAILFSFASCRNINDVYEETTTAVQETLPPPVVKEKKQTKEFKDENGRTVYVVDVVLPEISENIEPRMIDYVNRVINKFFEDACVQAELNVESASSFMDSYNSDKPWKRTTSFEATRVSGYFVCFLIKESLSYFGSSDNTPSVYTKCFQVQEEEPVNALYFAVNPDDPAAALGYITDLLKSRGENGFYRENISLNETQLAAFDEAVSLDRFYLTDDGMTFYVDKTSIDPDGNSGIYAENFTWEELEGMFNKPELY